MSQRSIFLWFVYKGIKRGATSGAYFGFLFGLLLLFFGSVMGAVIGAVMGFMLGLISGSVLGFVTLRFFVLPSTLQFYRRFCLLVYPLLNVALLWLSKPLLNVIFPGYSPDDTTLAEFVFYVALFPVILSSIAFAFSVPKQYLHHMSEYHSQADPILNPQRIS